MPRRTPPGRRRAALPLRAVVGVLALAALALAPLAPLAPLSRLSERPLPLVTGAALAASAPAPLPTRSEWLADVGAAMNGSRSYLHRRVQGGRAGERTAVNLDIDNTSLASHYDPGAPVPVVLRFARYARDHGVVLLFNTGRLRGEGRMVQAVRQLGAAGYRATEVCGRWKGESLARSKQRCRRHFVREGYTLVANVGNRSTDFTGGDYERAFRLPSYGNQLS